MAGPERFADAGSLRLVASAAFGAGRRLTGVHRLPGGTKKGAYRVTTDDGATALVYIWNPAEDYWYLGRPWPSLRHQRIPISE